MLGEPIAEEKGKITSTRVLSVTDEGAEVEVSFAASGQLMGMEMTHWGTYQTTTGHGDVLFGQGQGVFMTKDGDRITWTGEGSGRFTGRGGTSWRGAIFLHTPSQKLARLNGLCAVFEHEIDAEGNVHNKLFEWR